ncbi:MAG: T9SS type A sorting domain-containing protein, partial [Bacteroidales bacterium]|nr:T9SS type A sorting domain-containing protein [Bacteroidales bacterium]
EFMGQWNHWAFTKNAVSGEMKMYLNGELWQSGTGKTKLIDIEDLVFGSAQFSSNHYFGKIDEFRIWDKELDMATIAGWMNIDVDETHPNYTNLVAYYKFDEGTGTTTSDASPYGQTAEMHDYVIWENERGNTLSRQFETTTLRPNITFLQGEYDLIVADEIVDVWQERIANVVTGYEIVPRYGTMLHDSINVLSTEYLWQAGYEYTYNPEGVKVDSNLRAATDYKAITELNYYRRYPSMYEIMSFVTPYGIYLDLGMEGKTWLFDVTDYGPILKGWKRLSVELGGQRQEDMDIKFWYILGTPPRDVIDINQLWRASSNDYTALMNDRAFEPRNFYFNPDGVAFKVRSVITGHGQQGEFSQRWHSLNIDGDTPEFEWKVWTECADVAIYPQGGTWIFDRAGWCPGDPSDLFEYDITEYVSPGETHTIDYNLTYASGASNYQVNNQLVTYGEPNFTLDAAVINITKPNAENAAFERFNPACSYPVAVIQNTGATTLTSLELEYSVEGGEVLNYTWTGSLGFLDTTEVELIIPNYTFWSGSNNSFTVNCSNPNGQADEYEYNNAYHIQFAEVDLYDVSETLTIECKTNNQGYQTSYSLTDMEGNVIFEMSDLANATIYTNEVNLELGCYLLRIDDTGDNGLEFWYYPSYGAGYLRIKDASGNILVDIEPDFGKYAVYEFGIVDFTGTEEIPEKSNIVSVYPNPTSDLIHINLLGLENNIIDARIFDASMVLVLESQFCVEADDYTESIDIDKLPAGVYFLQLEYDGKKTLKKIVKK